MGSHSYQVMTRMISKTAFLFSGQGSQYAGMGIKLQRYSAGKKTFQEANDILGIDIADLCCNGTDKDLAGTEITQPAILTCSIAAFRILNEEMQGSVPVTSWQHVVLSMPSATAGLSVGEYSALVASKVLSFTDALKLVKERGRLMAEAAAANPGTMVAVLGLDSAAVQAVCQEASSSGIVGPANYNCSGQVVISGEEKAVQHAVKLARKAGAMKCIALNVSGAFHSVLMHSAESGLRAAFNGISFSKPEIPFIANVTGGHVEETEDIKEMLALQLSNPVQWETSVRTMIDDGITTFVEVGPRKILTGLVRRIYRAARIFNTDSLL